MGIIFEKCVNCGELIRIDTSGEPDVLFDNLPQGTIYWCSNGCRDNSLGLETQEGVMQPNTKQWGG